MFTFRKNGHFYEKIGKKGEPVCIDDEIPFDIPDSWEWSRLGFIGDWGAGSTPKRGEPKYYLNGTIPWLKTGDLNNGYINEVPEFITEIALKETSVRLNPIGSVLIAMYGATIGKVGILNIKATTNQACCACLPFNGIYNEFLFYYLMSQNKNFNKMGEGGAQPNISRTKIINYLFPIPSLNEQERIVDKIKEILPLIEEYGINEEKLNKLNSEFPDKLKSSILQEAIQGKLVPQDSNDESASVLLERIKDEKERLIKEKKIKRNKKESYIFKENNHFYEKIGKKEYICIDDEIPFEIPESWEWTRIKNISEFVTKGTTPKGGKSAYIDKGIKFLRVENIGKNGELILDNIKYIDEEIHKNFLKRSILKENDLLISIAGALGRTAIIPNNVLPLNTNQAVSFVRWFNTDLIFIPFVEKVINSPEIQKLLLKQSKVTAIPNLTLEIIRECLIPLPPLSEQQKIVNKINCIFEEIS